MQQISTIDNGQSFDWGRTSEDYARHRPGPPRSFYDRLVALGVGLPGQHVLDLGTGTGVVIREFAKRGVVGSGIDVAEEQITMAKALAEKDDLNIDFKVSPADRLPFPAEYFDVVIANQCWWYFDVDSVLREVRRVLKPKDGFLIVSHFNFIPRLDRLVKQTEDLILKHNPKWTGANWACDVPPMPDWAVGRLRLRAMFYYDEPVRFSRESWMGRIRACRGVSASLNSDQVREFDKEHDELLRRIAGESFDVMHRVDAHIFEFPEKQ